MRHLIPPIDIKALFINCVNSASSPVMHPEVTILTLLRILILAKNCSKLRQFGILMICLTYFCSGCGGGGSSAPVTPVVKSPNAVHGCASAFVTAVSGKATSLNGAPIVGAVVSVGSQSAITTQFGTYSILNVSAPASQSSVIIPITAAITIQGAAWSGTNTLEISGCDTNTTNVNIVMSPSASQGSIAGTISDFTGPLANARIFASAPDPAAVAYLNPRSFWTISDANGKYVIPALPSINAGTSNYTVTVSKDLYVNRAVVIGVTPGQKSTADFTVAPADSGPCSNSAPCPPVTHFSVISITTPGTISRSAQLNSVSPAAIARNWIQQKRGLRSIHASRQIQKFSSAVRTRIPPPLVYNIESDLFWDADLTTSLLGYDVLRSDLVGTKFRTIAVLRDPQADHFTDIDSVLTAGSIYYYSVAKLDTLNFPKNSEEGEPVQNNLSAVVPLDPQLLLDPVNKSSVSGLPAFTWPAIKDGSVYQVLVYDKFPDLQSTSNSAGVKPIWPVSSSDASSEIQAPSTQPLSYSLNYSGPPLISGHVYYWAVLTSDSGGGAYSISDIFSFTSL